MKEKLRIMTKKELENKEEANKGITLIALVITIIVLLILAGVSIATLTGDNGVLTKATEAKIETRGGTVQEKVDLWKTEFYAGWETDSEEEMLDKLKDEGLVYENEINRDEKIINIGRREIDYSLSDKGYDESNLVTEWQVSDGEEIGIPLVGDTVDVKINWGDGNIEDFTSNDGAEGLRAVAKHTYDKAGNYIVSIAGEHKGMDFDTEGSFSPTDSTQLISVLSWGKNIYDRMSLFGAENLISVAEPKEGIFSKIENFENAFYGCKKLETISETFFKGCQSAKNFNYAFHGCEALKSIPENLFRDCPNVISFKNAFAACRMVKTIPENLFKNCPNVTDFDMVFDNCNSLETIPENLFKNCPNATSFDSAFYNCNSLKMIPEKLFDNCQNVTDFSRTFYSCENLTGEAPKIYERTNVERHGECFYECTGLTNYAEIPSDWK